MRAPENNQNLNYKWCKISLRALTQKDWKGGKKDTTQTNVILNFNSHIYSYFYMQALNNENYANSILFLGFHVMNCRI